MRHDWCRCGENRAQSIWTCIRRRFLTRRPVTNRAPTGCLRAKWGEAGVASAAMQHSDGSGFATRAVRLLRASSATSRCSCPSKALHTRAGALRAGCDPSLALFIVGATEAAPLGRRGWRNLLAFLARRMWPDAQIVTAVDFRPPPMLGVILGKRPSAMPRGTRSFPTAIVGDYSYALWRNAGISRCRSLLLQT